MAMRLVPSAELASETQFRAGTPFDLQVFPESGDVKIEPSLAAAANLAPSAEETMERHTLAGAAVADQLWAGAADSLKQRTAISASGKWQAKGFMGVTGLREAS